MAKNNILQVWDLPRELSASAKEKSPLEKDDDFPKITSFETWERDRLWELMQKYRGNKSRVAEDMGMCRATLYKKLRRYGL